MPPRRVIGIDAGGTKLLGGVVDEQMVVHHRVRRTWRGADRQETIDIFTDAVEEVRAASPDVEAVGFGIPALVDQEAGVSRWSNHLPLDGVPFREVMSERLGLPVVVDNDGNMSMLAEARSGAAAGTRHAVMVLLGTGIAGGLWLNGDALPRRVRGGAELGHVVLQLHGPECPGDCPGIGCFEALVSGHAIGREGMRAAAAAPDSALGRRLESGKEIDGGIVTELAHGGDPVALRGARRDRRAARVRADRAREHLQPGGDRDRRRRGAGRRPAPRAGAGGGGGPRAAAGARGGADRARALRRRGGHDRRGGDGIRLGARRRARSQ